jgi:hypothetical protein
MDESIGYTLAKSSLRVIRYADPKRSGKRFQVTLATPEDVSDSVECTAPMMLEIYNARKIIFDGNNFL